MRRGSATASLIIIMLALPAVAAQNIRPLVPAEQTAQEPVTPRFVDRSAARILAELPALPASEPRHSNLRLVANVQTLDDPIELRGTGTGRISVEGAANLRLQISGLRPGSVVWLAGENDFEYERFESTDSVAWAPTTTGEVVYISAESDEELTIERLAVGTGGAANENSTCVKDLSCVSEQATGEVAEASRAIAMIRFVRGNESYVCTGALINDRANSGTPFFLTARHCIATAEEAASIEAVWDERTPACGGAVANRKTRTYGAELLVASAETDVALLRMRRVPSDRVFLGLELEPLLDGTETYRLSHPDGAPQAFSSGTVETDGPVCSTAPRGNFIYSSQTSGAVASGSSGSPLLLPGLRVAGQLMGRCGPLPEDGCATVNELVDGSVAAAWPVLSVHLDPTQTSRRRAVRP